ncbi:AP2/ERF domain-containing protein PFD0985w-like isoform X2 [Plodia interpunctella]|nr:AP2/ERF domain-containing protein PFD0985w-like isoform X2 [Plodia interpunctella]
MNTEDFPCDCCDVTFYEPSAMLYHNKFFHRQDTDLPAIGHSKKLKMINQCSLLIYYCPFCGQQYNNKVNLHKHMIDDHSDENQSPDDVLRCPLCDAIFYHLDAYEHHLSFHSIEDMYNESNEMAETVTEFSLESVPPIMERVENLEPDPKEMSEGGAIGLDDLLMAMGNSEDNPKKSKKHKKHKKSKKAAITLDEFLNMNKDVFGEGIDFQGIEEVPSQIVAKRFKVKKKAALPSSGSKMSAKDIEKLRKQGIIIKKGGTSVKKPIPTIVQPTPTKVQAVPNKSDLNVSTQNQSAAVNPPNEVLTKLINQSNNQIKIVRKHTQNISEANSAEDEKPSSPENIEVECDLIQRYTSSETEGEEKPENRINKLNEDGISDTDSNKTKFLVDIESSNVKNVCIKSNHIFQNNDEDADDYNKNIDPSDKIKNSNNPLTALKNVSQHIIVKSVVPSGKNDSTTKNEVSTKESDEEPSELKQTVHYDMKDKNINETSDKSLNALKHLSHLITIKPVAQAKPTSPINSRQFSEIENTDNVQMNSGDGEDTKDSQITQQNNNPTITNKNIMTPKLEQKQTSQKSLNPFKNVSNNVTIKPMTKKIQSSQSQSDMSQSSDEDEQILNSIKKVAKNQPSVRQIAVKQQNEVKSPALSPNVVKINQSGVRNLPSKDPKSLEVNTKNLSNVDLLKNLKNVTAKPISNSKSVQINKFMTPVNQKLTQIKSNKEINNEIEVYNIDDSDSDNGDDHLPSESLKTKVSDIQTSNLHSKPTQAFKHLNKYLTIKPTHQKSPQLNIKQDLDQDEFTDLPQEDFDTETEHNEDKNKAHFNKTNKMLQNTLKNLSKHITIKSRNSSPSSIVSTYGNKNGNSNDKFDNNFDSDNESNAGRVQITEVDDECPRKNDEFDEDFDAIVQSPHDSDSDDDGDHSQNKDFEDIESKIHANTVKRNENKNEESFKNVSKAITIKSLGENKAQLYTETAATTKGLVSLPNNISKELSIKPFKQGTNECNSNTSQQPNKISPQIIDKNNKGAGQQITRNQSSNQKICMSKNQINTVNKEVTVKTFQSKTVIEEITTTVTKTIKTVNQTVKQEVQTASQSCTHNVLRQVQGLKPQTQQPVKNYQGVVVRHAAPVGTKVRSAMNPVRSPRPPAKISNQLVPVRSVIPMNVRAPRMPTLRSSTPSTSTNSPKPIKMSPNIVNTAMNKRPIATEPSGPFSCFKKPKESLIPVSEMSSFDTREDESTVSLASSTQVNKSNVMNMTRTVKGNTVVSSTQMKSEISSCSQQLEKLNNMSGLRIVKTSQVKQASHAEEKHEVSPAKKITLEAIEKLQKQGLLVKKPRLDSNREDRYSDDDDGEGNFPQDEDFDDDYFS